MNYENLKVEIGSDYVAAITLNRPQKLNAFNSSMASELYTAFMDTDRDPGCRVILLKGAGRAFCVGIDINELGDRTAMEYREWIEQMERPLLAISRMKKPVIAQVQGVATANGMGLAVAADLTIAAKNARMGLTAINVGLNCVGPVLPVARSLGRKKALELLFYGDLISASEALELGLINRIVPKEELDSEGRKWAIELAKKSPVGLQIAKTAYYAAEDLEYETQFSYMNEAFARLCTSEDAKEGVKAFFEKRRPDWRGR